MDQPRARVPRFSPRRWLGGLVALGFGLALGAAEGRPGLVSFRRIAIPEDIPARLCTALTQDRFGFLWIGTQDGLVRYDGYSFWVYRPRAEDAASLGGSYVRTLMAAKDGRLWVGTFSGGVSVFDPGAERFVRYHHEAGNPDSLAHDRVEGIAEDGEGRLWFATAEGLDRLDPTTGRFTHFRHDPKDAASLADDQVRGLLVDRAGRLWVGSREGLQRWISGTSRFERVASTPGARDSLAHQYVSKLYEDAAGRVWIGTTENGAALLNPATGDLRRLRPASQVPGGLSHFWVYGFAEVAGEMWVATFGGGIDVVDPSSLRVLDRLRHDAALETSLGGDRIGALCVDRSGLAWVGTWGGGLARHDPSTRAFLQFRHSPSNPQGPTHPSIVRAYGQPDGSLWLGTNGNGIDVLDAEGRLIDGFRPRPADPGALADGAITCLARGGDGAMWVGTLSGVLHRLRPGSRRFDRFASAQGLPKGPIRAMAFGPDGALWVGSAEGLARVDPKGGPIRRFERDPGNPSSLSGRSVEALAFDGLGTLWVGTEHGLDAFDPATGRAVALFHDPADPASLPDNWVPDLMVARDGRLWVATQGGACILAAWDGHRARFESVNKRLGLAPGPVDSLIEDPQGQVWMGARLRVDPGTWTVRVFGAPEGNDLHDFFIASRSRTPSGALLFGAPEGLLMVRTDRLPAWTYAPPLVASSLRVEGVEVPGAAGLDHLRLDSGQRTLRLDFASLDLSAPQRLRYRYRLEGYDRAWTATDASNRSAVFTRLPPGHYLLRVQGTNRVGDWSPSELRLPLTVVPAFYQAWWFRGLLILGAVGFVFLLIRLRLRNLEARAQKLERLVSERTSELARKHHELEAAYRRIEEASLTDPLTGLRNRRFLEQTLPGDLDLVIRRHLEPEPRPESDLLFLLLDLDHFKAVNDTWGHAAGDAVLKQTATILKACLRASDTVVRWGGEEFLLVARFIDRRDGPGLAEKIRAAVANHTFLLPDGATLQKTCSLGFAAFPFVSDPTAEVPWLSVVQIADTALYAAKHSGRNGWVGVAATRGEAAQAFLAAPQEAVLQSQVEVLVAPERADPLWWS